MLPLSWLLLGWLVMIGVFFLTSLITLFTLIRNGVAGAMTYASTLIFIFISAGALLFTVNYFFQVDWSQSIDIDAMVTSTLDL